VLAGRRAESRLRRTWNLWTFRDGKLVEVSYYGGDQAAAFEAAGLRE
jgi:hypothetical protein